MSRSAVLFCGCLLACRGLPAEPGTSPGTPAARPADAGGLAPLPAQVRRIQAHLARDGGDARVDQALRPGLPLLPSGVDVVAVRQGARWTVAALEPGRVATGLEGAERVLGLWRQQGHAPGAEELARMVGTFAYYPRRLFVTREAVPAAADARAMVSVGAGLHANPGRASESLTFSYAIPDDQPGPGLHVAHFDVTTSGLIIDLAPHPEVR